MSSTTNDDQVSRRTRRHAPAAGAALDPRVEEVTWIAWRLVAASPSRLSSEARVNAATAVFDRIIENAWMPGRVALISEVCTSGPDRQLVIRFAVGILGALGTTDDEAAALVPQIHSRLHGSGLPFKAESIDPSQLLDVEQPSVAHAGLIRQRDHRIRSSGLSSGTAGDLRVLSRWNPISDPWSGVVRLLLTRDAPTRVRATVLATEPSLEDDLTLERTLAEAVQLGAANLDQPDLQAQLERAQATLIDLRASFDTPVLCAELAVSSSAPLPEVFLRGVAGCFTSESDVVRRDGHTVVASQRLLLGGFELERNPDGLAEAHAQGMPLRGGCQPHQLCDLVTLFESPLGWPLPVGGPIPTLPAAAMRELPVPAGFDTGVRIGVGPHDQIVRLPGDDRRRHLLAVGVPGTGKTTVLVAGALDDLEHGRGFVFLDAHGQAADRVVAHADDANVEIVVLDGADAATDQLELIPRLKADGSNLHEVEQAIDDLCEAIASSLADESFAGPRWFANARAILMLAACLGIEIAEAVELVGDVAAFRRAINHPAMPSWASKTLRNLADTTGTDGASLRDWLLSKFAPFTSTAVRRIIARPGEGIDAATVLATGAPLIVNLAELSRHDAGQIGQVIVAAFLSAVFQQKPDPNRPATTLYVDEAHRYPAVGMDRVEAEGRKFGLSLALATQSMAQLPARFADTMSGAAVLIALRQTPDGAARLAPLMDLPSGDLVDLPELHAYVRIAGKGTCSLTIDSYAPQPPNRTKDEPSPIVRPKEQEVEEPSTDDATGHGDPPFIRMWAQHRREQIAKRGAS